MIKNNKRQYFATVDLDALSFEFYETIVILINFMIITLIYDLFDLIEIKLCIASFFGREVVNTKRYEMHNEQWKIIAYRASVYRITSHWYNNVIELI